MVTAILSWPWYELKDTVKFLHILIWSFLFCLLVWITRISHFSTLLFIFTFISPSIYLLECIRYSKINEYTLCNFFDLNLGNFFPFWRHFLYALPIYIYAISLQKSSRMLRNFQFVKVIWTYSSTFGNLLFPYSLNFFFIETYSFLSET